LLVKIIAKMQPKSIAISPGFTGSNEIAINTAILAIGLLQ